MPDPNKYMKPDWPETEWIAVPNGDLLEWQRELDELRADFMASRRKEAGDRGACKEV